MCCSSLSAVCYGAIQAGHRLTFGRGGGYRAGHPLDIGPANQVYYSHGQGKRQAGHYLWDDCALFQTSTNTTVVTVVSWTNG